MACAGSGAWRSQRVADSSVTAAQHRTCACKPTRRTLVAAAQDFASACKLDEVLYAGYNVRQSYLLEITARHGLVELAVQLAIHGAGLEPLSGCRAMRCAGLHSIRLQATQRQLTR